MSFELLPDCVDASELAFKVACELADDVDWEALNSLDACDSESPGIGGN